MMYYRCKCGHSQAHTTMGVPSCTRCPKCGSDLAPGPNAHGDPQPHKFITKYDQNTGTPYEVCSSCYQRKSDLESEENETKSA